MGMQFPRIALYRMTCTEHLTLSWLDFWFSLQPILCVLGIVLENGNFREFLKICTENTISQLYQWEHPATQQRPPPSLNLLVLPRKKFINKNCALNLSLGWQSGPVLQREGRSAYSLPPSQNQSGGVNKGTWSRNNCILTLNIKAECSANMIPQQRNLLRKERKRSRKT